MNLENREQAEIVILELLKKYLSESSDIERIMKSVQENNYCIPMRYVHYEICHLSKKNLAEDDRKLISELMNIYG
ncbi:hypothetical protein Entas_4118 [Enterobacter soli]|uniref:hypothetical protein n=1 Tax=Enterobacter soli TaxID=885040 RepID=UPI000223D148|nr:hypothetical protein [Enterobacter soli]AEN66824.1 hypothetical protein Entas_4118 [Enterobacter soli]